MVLGEIVEIAHEGNEAWGETSRRLALKYGGIAAFRSSAEQTLELHCDPMLGLSPLVLGIADERLVYPQGTRDSVVVLIFDE